MTADNVMTAFNFPSSKNRRGSSRPSGTTGGGGFGAGYSGGAHGQEDNPFPNTNNRLGPKTRGSKAVSSSQRGSTKSKSKKPAGHTRTDKGQGFVPGKGFNRSVNPGAGKGKGSGGGKGKKSKFGGH